MDLVQQLKNAIVIRIDAPGRPKSARFSTGNVAPPTGKVCVHGPSNQPISTGPEVDSEHFCLFHGMMLQ